MQNTTAKYLKGIGRTGRLNLQCKISLKLFVQTVFQVTRGHELAFLPKEWRIVDGENHAQGWLINGNCCQGLRVVQISNSVANFKFFDATDGTKVSGLNLFNPHLAKAFKKVELFHASNAFAAITVSNSHAHVFF